MDIYKTAPALPNGANFFTSKETNINSTANNVKSPALPDASTFLNTQETKSVTILEQIENEPDILGITYSLGAHLILLIGIIVMIILLIKSIKNRKKIIEEISLETISHVQKKSLVLLILSIISCSILAIVVSIISTIFIYNAKKIFDTNFEIAKSKLNIANILNIISIALLTLTCTLLIFALFTTVMQFFNIATMFSKI